MNAKFTPGPWRIRQLIDDFGKNAPQIATMADPDGFGKPIASVCYLSEQEREANARLIAAAPELLASLETITKWGESAGFGNGKRSKQWTMFETARAAIAKARGEA